ncbi:MAG: hypothetical protein ACOZNI_04540 [Myxococcota bacterium]
MILLLVACSASVRLGDVVCERQFECLTESARRIMPYETEAECRTWTQETWEYDACWLETDLLDACVDAWRELSCEDVALGTSPEACDGLCE